ncbi:hypothetical protein E0H73_44085 [Kribbella pittospori]|uniref:Uncharacterized protein n=1 Tax=Kribbella pittospori TaxID=722689 RepID=A0A4R0JJ78_9ACTN|nr:hypothetical protein [Kribbella pittospori]TCC46327.1 hypothetical protein E0H73_44085 [Kribbella pittospori]
MTPARRGIEPSEVRVPADLAGPVDVALAKSVDQIPSPIARPGGSRSEVKWDGYLHEPVKRSVWGLPGAQRFGVDQVPGGELGGVSGYS